MNNEKMSLKMLIKYSELNKNYSIFEGKSAFLSSFIEIFTPFFSSKIEFFFAG
jgi:hypothetical protein